MQQLVAIHVEAGEELSTLEQTVDAGGWRLSATICELKKKFDLPILSYRRKGFGKVAFYRLVKCMHQSAQTDIFEKDGFPPENFGIRGQNVGL